MSFFARLLDLRVPANLLFVCVLAAGGFALYDMPVEEYPNVAFDQVEIETAFPGASAVEVERLVTKLIEDEIEDVRGIDWIRSTSVDDYSRVLVKAQDDIDAADFDALFRDLDSEVRRVVRDLPAGAEEPVVRRIEVESLNPVIQVVLGGEVGEDVLRAATEELERRLEALPHVRGINVFGRRDRELHVDLDPDLLAQHNLTVTEVADALALRNVNWPSGTLKSGGSSLTVRALGEWTATHELLDTPIRTDREGGVLVLREVGTVTESYEEALIRGRFRGKPCTALAVIKDREANALTVRDAVQREVERFQKEAMPKGMELTFIADTTVRIRSRITTLTQNILIGAGFVLLTLTLSLGLRMSLVALWGVAFAFLGSFVVLRFFEQSINTLSLFGLVLVSGMLVDDAIVVLENIVRLRDLGKDLRTACIEGVAEVAWPVTSSVLTTVAAFLPLLLMSGITGKFFAVIPIAVCAALVVSLLEAVFILPIHAFDFRIGRARRPASGGAGVGAEPHGGPARRSTVLERAGAAVVAFATGHRYVTAVLLVGLGAGTMVAAGRIRTVFFPSEYQLFFVNLKLGPGTSLDETTAIVDRVERELDALPKDAIESAFGTAGFYYDFNYQPHVSPNYAQILVTIADAKVRKLSLEGVMAEVRSRLAGIDLGGAALDLKQLNDGPPIGRPVTLRVQCDDLERLKEASLAVEAVARATPGVKDIVSGLELGKSEVYARIEPEQAALRGVSAAAIGRTLAAANQGLVATPFKDIDEDWDVRVRLVEHARRSLAELGQVRVRAQRGNRVPLDEVAVLGERPAHAAIERYQRERTVTITGDVDLARTSSLEANRAIERAVAPLLAERPGVRVLYAGEFEETQRSFDSLGQAFVVAMLVMYLILGTQFGSYVQPLVVLCSVPFALTGVVFGLLLVGDPLTVPVLLGTVGLAGVAVNDAIVLISFANDLVAQGVPPLEAARRSVPLRFRAVMLTTLTTIAGLVPSAVGFGGGRSAVWGPMATAFAFGLAAATAFTLLATPALYLIAIDLGALADRLWRRFGGRPHGDG